MVDILNHIDQLRMERDWSEYELAKRSGLKQSTISTWYRKKMVPSLASLEKICNAFGITMSQFLAEDIQDINDAESRAILDMYSKLSNEQSQIVFKFLQFMTN